MTRNREKIFLATKFGTVGPPGRVINGEPEYVKVAVERSLKKLGIFVLQTSLMTLVRRFLPSEITCNTSLKTVFQTICTNVASSPLIGNYFPLDGMHEIIDRLHTRQQRCGISVDGLSHSTTIRQINNSPK